MNRSEWNSALLVLVLAGVCRAGGVDFNRDVRPILSENCFRCHGFDPVGRKGGLRLDDRDVATNKLKSGDVAIVPGKPDASELVSRITTTDPDDLMPPPATGKKLKPEQIATLRRWVAEGAVYAKHWSFERPAKAPLPVVKAAGWPHNAIDYFVLARLEREGLAPSPEADKSTLSRRVALDVTGLPPSPEELDAFLKDTSPEAYERLVDRLLASPAYGEHWGRRWLDLARYADTKGYEKDLRRTIWPYRDWVIAAFNADMPYDQFTREQIAGDLLPHPTKEQLIATGFHRNTLTNEEGGVDAEEYRVIAVKDRVDTTVQVWMGLTMGCAKCHTHKYDPISQRDYYQFYAFFNQTQDANRGDDSPTIPVAGSDGKATVPTPILRELPDNKHRRTRLQVRGNFLDPGDPVDPAVLTVFSPMPGGAPDNRLGVAEWLVSRDNPLTARVAVNRLWAGMFGAGIVETQEDFGTQGSPPSDQDLLDWLAVDFEDGGWSQKKAIRTMVLSATYRQSSRVTSELAERDRFNRLLARGPHVRLEAETIRDQALAVSGLLSRKMFGPSVMPYQPPGMWRSTYSDDRWKTSRGEDQFRRGIYTFLKRTTPYPSMVTFDGTSRETCTLRRSRTNTPLQALVTLNDPVFVECAQALARRMASAGNGSVESEIEFGLRAALLRDPRPREVAILSNLYEQRLEAARENPKAAETLATDPLGPLPPGADAARLAALTSVANVILNLDEFLSKG